MCVIQMCNSLNSVTVAVYSSVIPAARVCVLCDLESVSVGGSADSGPAGEDDHLTTV